MQVQTCITDEAQPLNQSQKKEKKIHEVAEKSPQQQLKVTRQ
jgi:hypothetical protein